MDAVCSHDPRDFVARDWSDLVAADPHGTFFHTPAYLKLYWEEFGDDLDELTLVFAGDTPHQGAAAFERLGTTLRFLGGTEVTDYMGPVAGAGHESEVAAALLAALANDSMWTLADLRGLAEDSAWIQALVEAAAAQGVSWQLEPDDVTPRIALPRTWEDYLAGLSSKLRHEIRRKARKLDESAGGYRIVFTEPADLGRDLDRFIELHRSSEGPKGKFMQPGMEIFFRRLGEAFLPERVFRLAFLEATGVRVAGAIGFVYGKTFSLYNSAYDHGWRALAPGMVLVGELIRHAIEAGCVTFDMLKGSLAYKYRFGAVPRRLMRLQIARR